MVPLLHVGFRGRVETDASFRARLTTLLNHKDTCGAATWNSMMKYADELRARKIKIAFFSSTPQGGGVALMRHALVRFSRLTGVDLRWYGMSKGAPSPSLTLCLCSSWTDLWSSPQAPAGRLPGHQERPQHPPGRQPARRVGVG